MLKYISIENIAVIKKANIEFSNGFSVLTGETGAGKSILIDAINAVLGERTNKELIRNGSDSAAVTAVFEAKDKTVSQIKELGFSTDEDGLFYLQRTLNSQGRNVCRINGTPVPMATLREVGALLIDIHGQHDNRNLLDPQNHLSYLDKYAKTEPLIIDYFASFSALRTARRELNDICEKINDAKRMQELYEYQKREIENSSIRIGERAELVEKREIAKNSRDIFTRLETAINYLVGGESSGVSSNLISAGNELANVKQVVKKVGETDVKLLEFGYEIQELENELKSLLNEVDFSEAELETINDRISYIDSVIKKYGGSEESTLEHYENISKALGEIDSADDNISSLEAKIELLEGEVYNKGLKLTNVRKAAAKKFSDELCEVLKFLQMPKVVFDISFTNGKYTKTGCDYVEFLISANPGQPPKPLTKIASGGELSRIMLAIKSVFSDIDDVDTIIFDEIDTGISGIAADKVGEKLRDLSSKRQVICVTHLAQIAAKAYNHFLIEKNTDHDTTETSVKAISGDDRIMEIARIISGGEVTESLYNTSKELLNIK